MHYYKILKHKAGFDEATNDWEKMFAHYVADTDKHVIFGALPLTFKADGGAIHWTIYGNNTQHNYSAEGTLPLTFSTHTAGAAGDWTIYGNDDNGTENLWGDYETFPNTHLANVNVWTSYDGAGLCQRVKCEGNTEYTLSFANTSSLFRISASSTNDVPTANNPVIVQRLVSTTNSNSETFTTPNNAKFIIVQISYDEQELLNSAMLVKGSTAPDHYIPYQQGVGERTENKMPIPVNGVYSANRTTVTVTDGVYHIVQTEGSGSSSVFIDLPEFEVPDSGYINYLNSMDSLNSVVVLRYNNASLSGGYVLTPINRAAAIGSDYAGKKVDQIQIYTTGNATMDFTLAPMITDSNAYTTYIPYGYKVPLTVSQQGQTDKNYDIYIGDSPLTEGETVSKQSTGVDIELFEGSNTVNTTLYNKPSMSIEGVDYVGVGEYVNGQWQIPLTISSGNQSTDYTIPIDAPLTEGQSVTDTVEITAYEGTNTLDTTLAIKPNVEITYEL